MSRLFIHVGYPKAGSTWLQRFLFDNADAGFAHVAPMQEHLRNFAIPYEMDFDAEACRQAYEARITEIESEGLVPVISSEALVGDIHGGGFESLQRLSQLKKTFPEAKILMIIREQQEMVFSVYKEFVGQGGVTRIQVLFDPPYFPSFLPRFKFSHYQYHRLIERYQEVFGKENVLVLPLEMLHASPTEYITRISSFAGIKPFFELPYSHKENKSWRAATYVAKRYLNLFLMRSPLSGNLPVALPYKHYKKIYPLFNQVDRMIPAAVHQMADKDFRAIIQEKTMGYYEESNLRTSEMIGIDLEKYGYSCVT